MKFEKWWEEQFGNMGAPSSPKYKETWDAGRTDLAEHVRDWIAKLNEYEGDYDVYPEDITELMSILKAR